MCLVITAYVVPTNAIRTKAEQVIARVISSTEDHQHLDEVPSERKLDEAKLREIAAIMGVSSSDVPRRREGKPRSRLDNATLGILAKALDELESPPLQYP